MRECKILVLIFLVGSIAFSAIAQEADTTEIDSVYIPAPRLGKPTIKFVRDLANDRGNSIEMSWEITQAQIAPSHIIVYRSQNPSVGFSPIDTIPNLSTIYVDPNAEDGQEYYYQLASYISDEYGERTEMSEISDSVSSTSNWFNRYRTNMLIALLIFISIVCWYIYSASTGKTFFVRKIPGLTAIGEAVGRSTEMGKPVLYVTGIGVIEDIQTLASLVILSEVAKVTATYDTPLIVPLWDPVLMTAAEEIVKESYMDVGRPDSFNADNIRYVTSEQFAYAAGVNGIMLRERPAAIIYMGVFYAESLMLAETGFAAGAIQVAGTAMVSQIPFFIAACDYCLIGEELFAASAYLSKDPRLIANLKSSDWGKLLFAILTIIGVISVTFGKYGFANLFITR
jgi:hypothetical protein